MFTHKNRILRFRKWQLVNFGLLDKSPACPSFTWNDFRHVVCVCHVVRKGCVYQRVQVNDSMCIWFNDDATCHPVKVIPEDLTNFYSSIILWTFSWLIFCVIHLLIWCSWCNSPKPSPTSEPQHVKSLNSSKTCTKEC